MTEEYRDIKGYEGYYQVSNLGNVRSLDRLVDRGIYGIQLFKGRVLKPRPNDKGYLRVQLTKDGTRIDKYIHRLVAEAFLENPDNLPEVNHKDETGIKNGHYFPIEEREKRYRENRKAYYLAHKEEKREYSKLYMRAYRERKRAFS